MCRFLVLPFHCVAFQNSNNEPNECSVSYLYFHRVIVMIRNRVERLIEESLMWESSNKRYLKSLIGQIFLTKELMWWESVMCMKLAPSFSIVTRKKVVLLVTEKEIEKGTISRALSIFHNKVGLTIIREWRNRGCAVMCCSFTIMPFLNCIFYENRPIFRREVGFAFLREWKNKACVIMCRQ